MQQFSIKPIVYFNEGSLNYLQRIQGKHALIVTDSVMKQFGFTDKITKMLSERHITSDIFSDVLPDPDIAMIVKGMDQMYTSEPDILIAVGGGSVIDTAKGIMYALCKLSESKGIVYQKPHFIAIPSTSGTGSEVTAFSVIKLEDGKMALVDDYMLPDAAVLDPYFVSSVPPKITADTGIDALCHVLEAYVSTDASDFTDALCEKTVKLVFSYLLTAYKNGSDKEAREKMHNASCMAGMAFTNASLGINHSLAHALGGIFHIPHGRANALLLPYIIAYNAQLEHGGDTYAARRYAALARMLNLPADTPAEGTESLIQAIKIIKNEMEIPKGIREMNIDQYVFEQKLSQLAELALNDNCTLTNPRKPLIDDIKKIYRDTYNGC